MNKTIQHILEEGKNSGFSVVEAFAEKTERQEYECFAGDIPRPAGTAVHRTCHTEIGRIATRAFWETGDPVGFSLSKPGLKEIKNAFSNIYSIRLPSPEKNYAPALPASTDKVNVAIYDNAFNGVGLRQFQELTEQMEEHLVSAPFKELRIKKIHLTKTLKKIYIANTNGLNAKYIKTGFNILLRVTLNGSTLDISDSRTFFDRLDSYKLVSRAYNLLTSLTETPITLDQQNIPLVLSPEASAFVLREFAEYFKITADRKFGEMPLPSILNIVDDPLLDGGAGSVPFDDEGTQAGEKFLVRKGSFSTYISDVRRAHAAGTVSTGNGFRSERSLFPNLRFSNLYIKPTVLPLKNLLEDAGRGVLVSLLKLKSVEKDHYIFSAYGYIFNGDQIGEPVHFFIKTAFPGYFLNVVKVSKGLKFFSSVSNIGSPYVLVKAKKKNGLLEI